MKVSASYLTAENKKEAINKLNETTIDYLHIDYMDGIFVKRKTETLANLKKLLKDNKKPLDVHLMTNPKPKLIQEFAMLNTDCITIHLETDNIEKNIELIKNYGIKAGLAIKPNTDVRKVFKYLNLIDLVLVMSVEPGEGGQAFLDDTLIRLSALREEIKNKDYNTQVAVDGGINDDIILALKEEKIDIAVVGSFITKENNYQIQINKLK